MAATKTNVLLKIDSTPLSDEPLVLRASPLAKVTRGTPLPTDPRNRGAFYLYAKGGTGGHVFSIENSSAYDGLPPGLSLNATTGLVTGTPTTVGHYRFRAKVQDSSSTVAEEDFTLDVVGSLVAMNVTPTDGEVDVPYSYLFQVRGNTGPVQWTYVSGTIPSGLGLLLSGRLTGTPTTDGTSYFVVRATDTTSGDNLDIACRVQIYTELSISPQTLTFTVGIYGEFQIQTTGGRAPVRFMHDSTGPFINGLSMSPSGLVSGIPAGGNSQARNIRCYDSLGGTDAAFVILKSKETNSIIQPQKNTVDVGPEGPSKINLVEGANVAITASNDGTTVTYEISASSGGGIETVNGIGPDSSGNVTVTGAHGPFQIALFDGSASTAFGSSSRRVAGGRYFDPTDAKYGLTGSSTATLCMLLESTSGSVAAAGELFQKSGTGSPQIIAATSTTTSTTATLVTADVSAAFLNTSAPGIFVARFWIVTPNGVNQATCTGAWIEITP